VIKHVLFISISWLCFFFFYVGLTTVDCATDGFTAIFTRRVSINVSQMSRYQRVSTVEYVQMALHRCWPTTITNTYNHMGVTNCLTQQLDVIKFILTTIVSAPYKAIIWSNLQKENFLSI
jgi:hypothetical protein